MTDCTRAEVPKSFRVKSARRFAVHHDAVRSEHREVVRLCVRGLPPGQDGRRRHPGGEAGPPLVKQADVEPGVARRLDPPAGFGRPRGLRRAEEDEVSGDGQSQVL